jgi:alpha-galactosidase
MGTAVRLSEAAITLENERVQLVVHLADLRMALRAHTGATQVVGFAPRIQLEGGSLLPKDGVVTGQSQLGPVTRVAVGCHTEPPLGLSLEIALGSDWSGIHLSIRLENRGDAPVSIQGIEPFHWREGEGCELGLAGNPKDLRFFQMGYQSWSPAAFMPLRSRERLPRFSVLRHVHFGPFTPLPRRGLHVSDFMTTLCAPGHAGLTLGFLTHHNYMTHVALEHRGAHITGLSARVPTEGVSLEPRSALESERLWIGLDPPDEDGLVTWADRTASAMNARVPGHVGTAWSSWYQFYTGVTAEDIRRNARDLSRLTPGIETFQIDDGFQSAVGDWLQPGDGFPDGVAPLAREIRSAGFRAGLWLAPFLVSRASELAKRHPDWLLRRRNGRPRVALLHPVWKGKLCYALDPTHPEVLVWLEELARTVRGYGFDYLKLDFLYAGALRGRQDPEIPSAAAYRSGIEAIRRGVGEDCYLVGCGAPLVPSVGLFEAMRIGPDVAPRWKSPLADAIYGVSAAPSARNSLRNVVARASLHGRLWHNDPDCVLLRDRDTGLSETEVQALVSTVAVSGGLAVISDDLGKLGDQRRNWLQRLLPVVGQTPMPGKLRGQLPDGLQIRLKDGSLWLLLLNLGQRPFRPRRETSELGFTQAVHVYDIWEDRYLGAHLGALPLDPIPAHGCRLLRLCPTDTHPQVVGSTLHLSAGGIETVDVGRNADGTPHLRLALPGKREGKVTLALDPEQLVRVRVAFEDNLELRATNWPPGLEEPNRIPDG